MMTEIRSEIDEFYQLLEKLYHEASKESHLEKAHDKAWERFSELGLPTRKNEVFRYLKLRQLYSKSYEIAPQVNLEAEVLEPYIFPECRESLIVFVNGHFAPTLSCLKGLSEKIVFMPINAAMRTYGTLLTNQLSKAIKEETDPFALLNLAMHGQGAFLYLPPKVFCKAPTQVLYLTDTRDASALATPWLQLFIGASAEMELISTHAQLSSTLNFVNQRVDLILEENAHLRYVQANNHPSDDLWHFDALRATLKKASSLKTICVSNGSETIRNDYRVVLAGEGSEAQLNGIWLLKERREMHHHIYVDHQAPKCFSRQLFKGVLYDQSHSSFEGKIMVRQAAQETNAFQLNNNLLLSDGASAESKPNLEIFADNVKASHGATVGQLEKEELFYLQSRGFSLAEAQRLLVYGFCQEVIHMIPQPFLRKQVEKYVTQS